MPSRADDENLFVMTGGSGDLKRALGCGQWVLIALTVIALVLSVVHPYTQWMWFVHDVRQPRVFTLSYQWRGTLFAFSFALSVAVLYLNMRKALRLSTMLFLRSPQTPGEELLGKALKWFREKGETVAKFVALFFSVSIAAGFSNNWMLFLLSQNAQPFGKKDPTYGIDLSFFVFNLPFYREALGFALWLTVLAAALTLGSYVGLQVLASLAKVELNRPQVRGHLQVLLGIFFILAGVRIWITRFEIGLIEGTQFTGGGASAQFELAVRQFCAILTTLVGLVTLARIKVSQSYRVPAYGALAAFGGYLLVGGMGGTVFQRVLVDPDRLDKERPFAEQAIAMTRYAYGIDAIETRDFATKPGLSPEAVAKSRPTLDGVRLWDPEVLRWSLERLQSPKSYYAFHDVDVDRYTIDGRKQLVMLAPRDLNLAGLDPAAQNWTNLRLRYTHGYGVAVAPVDEATAEGEPVLIGRDIPQVLPPELKLDEPRIYFSDYRTRFQGLEDSWALVNTKEPEFSYPTETGSATHSWTANRGVPIGGLGNRIAWGLSLGDRTLLFASNVTADSRLLVNRNVIQRSRTLYPFLQFDQDPYIVIHDGRLKWILDGYTVTDMIPYSVRLDGPVRVNYIRNSVKVVIDAYSGEINAFATQEDEPILNAWRKIYPGLIAPFSELPKGLENHLRYPEDMFKLQAAVLTQYHVTDPVAFLSNAEAWQLPIEQGLDRRRSLMRPYYVTIQVGDSPEPEFMLILPFTPNGKPNMSGWLGAHCDPKNYGKLNLIRFSKGVPLDGPEVMETNFNSWPEVSNINRQYQNDQSEIVQGNLLVIPIGSNVLYLEPMFLRSKTTGLQARPRLFKVVLSMDNRIVVGDTYAEALDKLLRLVSGKGVPPAGPRPANRPASPTGSMEEVRRALELLDQADAALRSGDFARYGQLQKQAREELEQIVTARTR